MKRALLALALLAACKTTALYSSAVPGLWQQVSWTLNTTQPCLDAPELLACAERMAPLLLARAVAAGYARDMEQARRAWGRPGICLVQRPEACRRGYLCAAGSSGPDCRPRAGCTIENSSWISAEWPAGVRYDYSSTLETELRISIAGELGIPVSPQHNTPWELTAPTGVKCSMR